MRAVNLLPADLRGAAPKPRAPRAGGAGPGHRRLSGAGRPGPLRRRPRRLRADHQHGQAAPGRPARPRRQRRDVANAKAAALKPYADFEALANAPCRDGPRPRRRALRLGAALRDLSRAMPADVKLQSLNGDMGLPGATGPGGDPLRGSIPRPAITMAGCAPTQHGRRADDVPSQAVRRASPASRSRSPRSRRRRDDRRRDLPVRQGQAAELLRRRLLRALRRTGRARAGRRRARQRAGAERGRTRPAAENGASGDAAPPDGAADPAATAAADRPRRPPPPRPRPGAPRDPHQAPHPRRSSPWRPLAAFWFLVLAPKREEIAKLDTRHRRAGEPPRQPGRAAGRRSTRRRRTTTARTTRRSRDSARPSPPMTTCARCSCRSTTRPPTPKVDFRSLSVEPAAAPTDPGRRGRDHDRLARARPGLRARRQRRLLGDAVQLRVQRQLLPPVRLLRPAEPLRRRPGQRRSTSPAGCC